MVTIGEKRYIIDCAYRQFFQRSNNEEKHETLDLKETMSSDEHKKELAEKLLKYGWIEATPENIKKYLDGFIVATAGDKNINLPTEQEYMKNIEGETLSTSGKIIHKYEIKDLWKLYVKNWSPNISEEMINFKTENRNICRKIKNNLVFETDTFSIVLRDGKNILGPKMKTLNLHLKI